MSYSKNNSSSATYLGTSYMRKEERKILRKTLLVYPQHRLYCLWTLFHYWFNIMLCLIDLCLTDRQFFIPFFFSDFHESSHVSTPIAYLYWNYSFIAATYALFKATFSSQGYFAGFISLMQKTNQSTRQFPIFCPSVIYQWKKWLHVYN